MNVAHSATAADQLQQAVEFGQVRQHFWAKSPGVRKLPGLHRSNQSLDENPRKNPSPGYRL
jgi:hypothetical protein